MKLIEADGKALLRRHGVPTPRGLLLASGEAAPAGWTGGAAVKAQIAAGGRGHAGLVRLCADPSEIDEALSGVRAALAARGAEPLVLLEERAILEEEFYLAVRIDDAAQCPELLFSPRGGVEVETHPEALRRHPVDPLRPLGPHQLAGFFRDAGAPPALVGALCRFAVQVYEVFRREDAELVEINPLAATPAGLLALDAKVSLDDAAAFRHRDREGLASAVLREQAASPLEARGAAHGITFVDLDGDVAVFTGGAGLGMVVLDALIDAGYRPANFVDTVSGSDAGLFQRLGELVFEHARQPQVRAILAYFTLSATSLKGLVDGLQRLFAENPPPKPLVLGMHASGAAEAGLALVDAQALFRAQGYDCAVELHELIDLLQARVPPSPTGASS